MSDESNVEMLTEPVVCEHCGEPVFMRRRTYPSGAYHYEIEHASSAMYDEGEVMEIGQGNLAGGLLKIVQAALKGGHCYAGQLKPLSREERAGTE